MFTNDTTNTMSITDISASLRSHLKWLPIARDSSKETSGCYCKAVEAECPKNERTPDSDDCGARNDGKGKGVCGS
jgi:hypothetical protein